MNSPKTLRQVIDDYILKTLAAANGNKIHTARLLGISIRGLRNRLHAMGRRDLIGDVRTNLEKQMEDQGAGTNVSE